MKDLSHKEHLFGTIAATPVAAFMVYATRGEGPVPYFMAAYYALLIFMLWRTCARCACRHDKMDPDVPHLRAGDCGIDHPSGSAHLSTCLVWCQGCGRVVFKNPAYGVRYSYKAS